MGRRGQPVVLADLYFASKKACAGWCRRLLNERPLRYPVFPEDIPRLTALLHRHPEAEQNIGSGIRSFCVDYAPSDWFNQRCFYVSRTDGSRMGFSYVHCISGRPRTTRSQFLDAARLAVEGQIMRFKTAWLRNNAEGGIATCPVNGQRMTEAEMHVGYRPPEFVQLVDQFISSRQLEITYGDVLSPPADGQGRTEIVNHQVLADWLEFHQTYARLRVLSAEAHMHPPSKGRTDRSYV